MIRISLLALALSFSVAACGGEDDSGDGNVNDCDTSTLTYANFGQSFMSDYCLECHSSSVSGGARNGAPVAVNFDDLSLIQTQQGRIKARVGASTMPPASAAMTPGAAERNDLVEWIECGTN